MKIEKELKGLTKSFTYALRGIKSSIVSERNMRIHIVITIFVLGFSFFYDFSRTEYIVLIFTISSVIACEMMNTAVETVVDLVSPSYNKFAQLAKDIAAGAVFVFALGAVVVGIFLFFDVEKFIEIKYIFLNNPCYLVVLVLSLILGMVFIFRGTNISGKKKFKGKKFEG